MIDVVTVVVTFLLQVDEKSAIRNGRDFSHDMC